MRLLRVLLFSALYAVYAPAASNRLQVFISDLHFGVGKDPATGKWHNLEDARWAPEFALFLREMDRMGNGAADLILNGDTFELWQSTEQDCITPQDPDLGCTEEQALRRVEKVLRAHKTELDDIAKFAANGSNSVVLVPGNHDAALLYQKVAARVMEALRDAKGHARIAPEGYWLSSDSLLYAEHGHEIGEELNRFSKWPVPFLMRGDARYMQRPWGEQFVQQFYNDFEVKYPIIDNFTTDGDGVRFGLATEGWSGSPIAVGKLVRFLFLQVSPSQFARSASGADPEHPAWDIREVRKRGDAFLVESLPADDPLRDLLAKATAQGTLQVAVSDFTDEDISGICDRRMGMDNVARCPALTQGALLASAIPRDKIFESHLDATYNALAAAGKTTQRFQFFIMSHTHNAGSGFQPMARTQRPWQPTVVNTGAWQRTISAKQMETLMAERKIAKTDVLKTVQLEDLPACYDVILVRPYSGVPKTELSGWQRGADGMWKLGLACR